LAIPELSEISPEISYTDDDGKVERLSRDVLWPDPGQDSTKNDFAPGHRHATLQRRNAVFTPHLINVSGN
jgi:hypothetical protein